MDHVSMVMPLKPLRPSLRDSTSSTGQMNALNLKQHGSGNSLNQRPTLGNISALTISLPNPPTKHSPLLVLIEERLHRIKLAPFVPQTDPEIESLVIENPLVGTES